MPRDVQEPVPSKFVIRKLPPELTEDAFGTLLRGVCRDELDWFRYHPGGSGDSGIVTSTAFVKLKHPELAPVLKQVLQNSPFIGDHGVPYHCEMEVAIYQRTPKERAKEDPYVATYEQDPYFKDFLKEIEREDEAARKGPTITATTTIAEDTTEKEPVVTPLMSYIINRYKSSSGRARNGKGSTGDGREKENRKRLQVIPEKPAIGKSAAEVSGTGKAAPGKRGRGSKKDEKNAKGKANITDTTSGDKQESGQPGKTGRGKGSKGQARSTSNGGSSGGGGPATVPSATTAADGTAVAITSADVAAARSAAQAAARVAMQLASEKDGLLSAVVSSDGTAKNGAKPSPAKSTPKRPRTGRRARGRGGGEIQEGDGANADTQMQSQGGEAQTASISDRAIAAAAAAASAALQDSAPGERPRPRTRPALGARGVRDALSRAGIKQPAGTSGGSRKQKGGGGNGAKAMTAGDEREGSSGP